MNTPSYVKPSHVGKWNSVYQAVSSTDGPQVAMIAANNWLLKQPSQELVSKTISKMIFEIDTTELVKKTADGESYITAVLADNLPDSQGDAPTLEVLQKWADQINKNSLIGDVDHAMFDKLVAAGLSNERIKTELKNKPGIARTIKAMVQDGKLYIRAIIDKRYQSIIQKAKGLSLEALWTRNTATNSIVDGELLGFTFGVADTPANPRAVVLA